MPYARTLRGKLKIGAKTGTGQRSRVRSFMGLFWPVVILVAAVVVVLLVLHQIRRPGIPLPVSFLRQLAAIYLAIFKRLRVIDARYIPNEGPLILVANHTTSYDPICLQAACKNRLIRWMQAREFYEKKPLLFLYRLLKVIPVNRTGNDTASVRTALRALTEGGCIGIFPEGRMSEDGGLTEPRKGVALLALMANAAVVPAYISGTHSYRGILRDLFQFNRVTLRFGPPIRFDDLAGRARDPAARDIALERIVQGIMSLREDAGEHAKEALAP
jgi:1-acyl-sn-glycerol-3-phosphate acyltransferase